MARVALPQALLLRPLYWAGKAWNMEGTHGMRMFQVLYKLKDPCSHCVYPAWYVFSTHGTVEAAQTALNTCKQFKNHGECKLVEILEK
jgi:hypothetical protein